ncbi:MAG: PIN domain-containing protein [Candidatus Bipolaricaulota bacterium]|nr:PIN domain-containing protein [Candidatus Bipolaricaulota bacterium]MCS7273821.1 PIN domain-containing protein [Candidatus Bipolaricaulota bacterium]MDW8110761.1 PIN domain-containing protein [Candidatus Bipolaricaulota bacterium]MDW8328381.1 PIN domain-containing protein [Candidatus Bipolaricaulota bacterium]
MSNAASSTKNATAPRDKLRVFFDADVLIAGSVSKTHSSASYILLQLAELTLIEGVICPYVREEVERNLKQKLPQGLPIFQALVQTALKEVPDPPAEFLREWAGRADPKDLVVLVAAYLHGSHYLVTFNTKDYPKPPESLKIIEPGELVRRVRAWLAELPQSLR